MPRMNEWQQDVYDALRRENWSLRGPKCVVKVLPYQSPASALGGYITIGLSLLGKKPKQIEVSLGLKEDYLKNGARIYRFKRLPMIQEYEYELTTAYPGGLAYSPGFSDENYRPGSPPVPQWAIKEAIYIPVDPKGFLDVRPEERVLYDWLVS